MKWQKRGILSIVIIFLIIFGISFLNIIFWYRDYRKTIKIVDELKDIYVTKEVDNLKEIYVNPPEDDNDIYWQLINKKLLSVDLTEYKNKNADTVAWLKIDNTNVDYPLVKSTDNKFYLNKNFAKENSKAGWIFSDYRNNFLNLNYNTIIYGHKRKDKTMFGTLDYLLNEHWYDNLDNYLIYLSTDNINYLFQVFSVYTIYQESYYIKTNFINKEEYQKFLDTIKERSKFNLGNVNIYDKILTLSTCLDNNGNRIVVHAKLIKKEIRD